MKVLLDEMLPAAVAGLLPDHAVVTVKAAGYTQERIDDIFHELRLAQDRQGRTASIHEKGYHFFQPTHPEARELLLGARRDRPGAGGQPR